MAIGNCFAHAVIRQACRIHDASSPLAVNQVSEQSSFTFRHSSSFFSLRSQIKSRLLLGAIQVLRNADGVGGVSSYPKNSVTKV